MNRLQHRENLGDRIGADVDYRGVNVHRQHLFANGSPLINFICDTPEEGIARFGQRIKISDKVLKYSAAFQKGLSDATYSPREGADQQELHEYGSGYLKRLLSPPSAVAPVIARTASMMTSAEIDAMKAEAAKVAANHAKIMAQDPNKVPYTHEQLMSMGGRPGGHLSNTPPITQPQPIATETPPVPTVTEPPASEQMQGEEDFA